MTDHEVMRFVVWEQEWYGRAGATLFIMIKQPVTAPSLPRSSPLAWLRAWFRWWLAPHVPRRLMRMEWGRRYKTAAEAMAAAERTLAPHVRE